MSQEVLYGVVAVPIPEISKLETVRYTLSKVVLNKSFERSYRVRLTINRNP